MARVRWYPRCFHVEIIIKLVYWTSSVSTAWKQWWLICSIFVELRFFLHWASVRIHLLIYMEIEHFYFHGINSSIRDFSIITSPDVILQSATQYSRGLHYHENLYNSITMCTMETSFCLTAIYTHAHSHGIHGNIPLSCLYCEL